MAPPATSVDFVVYPWEGSKITVPGYWLNLQKSNKLNDFTRGGRSPKEKFDQAMNSFKTLNDLAENNEDPKNQRNLVSKFHDNC